MAYCNADIDVRPLILQVTDDVKTDDQVAYFIGLADDYINARLASLYSVPFSSTPPVIKQISSHLAAHLAIRAIYAENRQDPKDSWMLSFKNWAKELLNEIEKGDILLVDSSGTRIARASSRGVHSSSPNTSRVFDVDDETSWKIPTSELDGVEEKRSND